MKNFNKLLFSCCLFFAVTFNAQQEVNTSFGTQMDATFSAIDRTKVPDGILLDYGMEFTNVPAFNGTLTDSTYVNHKNIREIYNTLLMSRIRNVSDGFVTPATFDANWLQARNTDYVALSGLYFKYGAYADDALATGKVQYTNAKFYDVVGQNPYNENKTFAITSPMDSFTGFNVNVKLPQTLFYSNANSEIQKIEIDFGDGAGYKTAGFNQILSANYNTEGVKTWLYKLTLTNGQTMVCQSKILINKGLNIYNGVGKSASSKVVSTVGSIFSQTIFATTSLSGTALGKAVILVDDAGNDGIKKPLIVVEGFDMDRILHPENLNGIEDFNGLLAKIILSKSTDLKKILTDNATKQYDIIFVKWQDGLDYIQNNAYVLEEVIKWVNQQKALNGSTEKNIIIGQSMGGLVVRYALKDMEQKGLTHQTRLYVNQDGPQQGANVPLGYQAAYRHVGNIYNASPVLLFGGQVIAPLFGSIPWSQYLTITEQPATKQLVRNRLDENYNLENSLYNSFQSELKTKGYPQAEGIRNIAISNGSECGNTQTFNAGDKLLGFNYYKGLSFWGDLLSLTYNPLGGFIGGAIFNSPALYGAGILGLIPGHSKYSIDIYTNSVSYAANSLIYHNKISYTKKILWIVPVTVNITNKNINQPSNVLPFDYYGGSYIDIKSYIGSTAGLSGVGNFTIVPTPSALDLGNGNISITDTDYKTPYNGVNPPSFPKNSPFASFITAYSPPNSQNGNQNGNEYHLQFTQRNGNWLAAEINNTPYTTTCAFLCSAVQINGDNTICNSSAVYSLPAGAESYNWSISGGNNQVTLSGNGTPNITLTKTGNYNGSIILNVTLGDTTGKCGQITLTKTIWLGGPLNNISTTSNCPSTSAPCGLSGTANNNYLTYSISANDLTSYIPNNEDVQWEKIQGNFYFLNNGQYNSNTATGQTANIYLTGANPNNAPLMFRSRVQNSCSWGDWRTYSWSDGTITPTAPITQKNYYKIATNPVQDVLVITLVNGSIYPTTNSSVIGKIYNMSGYYFGSYLITGNPTILTGFSWLQPGVYIFKIAFDDQFQNINFLKQ